MESRAGAHPTAPFLSASSRAGWMLCLGQGGWARMCLLVERLTLICVTLTGDISTSVMAEGAAHRHFVFCWGLVILLTLQYVLKTGNVPVFCKDLGPIFPFLGGFLFLFFFCVPEGVLGLCRAAAEGPWQCHQPPPCPKCCNKCLQTPG